MNSELELLVADLLVECRADGLSPKTIEAYRWPLQRAFLPWCEAQGIREPRQLSTRLLNRFKAHLLEEGGARGPLSDASVDMYVRAVQRLLAFGRREKEVGAEVTMTGVRLRERQVETLTMDEMVRMEEAARSERDALIVRVLRTTGLRASELLQLTDQDLVEDDGRFYLRILTSAQGGGAKGVKSRRVGVERTTFRRLQKLTLKRPADYEGSRLFIQATRRPGRPREGLSTSGLLQMLSGLARQVGISKRVYTHLFRHSFATEALRRGLDPLDLARILGHSGLTMIWRHYGHLLDADRHDRLVETMRSVRA